MNKKVLKVAFMVAIAMVGGINVFNSQKPEPLSDIALANVEALAGGELFDGHPCEGTWDRLCCVCGDKSSAIFLAFLTLGVSLLTFIPS